MFLMLVPATLGEQKPATRSVSPFPLGSKIRRCLALAEISDKAAALTMGLDPSEFSKQLADKPGHYISLARLQMLPDGFWDYFMPELAEHHGFRVQSVDVTAAMLADLLERTGKLMRLASFAEETQPMKRRA